MGLPEWNAIDGTEDFYNRSTLEDRVAYLERSDCGGPVVCSHCARPVDEDGTGMLEVPIPVDARRYCEVAPDHLHAADGCGDDDCPTHSEDAATELDMLKGVLDQEQFADTFYNENFMETYAEQFADDIHGVGQDSFLFSYINWASLAEDLANDMQEVEIDGTRYYAR